MSQNVHPLARLKPEPSDFMLRHLDLFRGYVALTATEAAEFMGLSKDQSGNALGNVVIHGLVERHVVPSVNDHRRDVRLYTLTQAGYERLRATERSDTSPTARRPREAAGS